MNKWFGDEKKTLINNKEGNFCRILINNGSQMWDVHHVLAKEILQRISWDTLVLETGVAFQ
jgi:hypothetical protein